MFQHILASQNLEHFGNVLHAFILSLSVFHMSFAEFLQSSQVFGNTLTNGFIKVSLKLWGTLSPTQQFLPKILGFLGGRQHEV